MTIRRMTVQELANACGLSRNTVSKVLNDKKTVPESTRQLVLQKAQELGFFQFAADPQAAPAPARQNIALLAGKMPADSHFGSMFIPAFAGFISRAGYTLMIYELTDEEFNQKKLPENISLEQTAAILGIELFDFAYTQMLAGLGLPTLLVDHCSDALGTTMESDWISMENRASVITLVRHMTAQGAHRLGFVGDPKHCNSFQERWIAFNYALQQIGLTADPALSICDPDESPYGDTAWIRGRLEAMPELPDALLCANDYLAIQVMTALKQMGVAIPQRVMVAGFDGNPQSAVTEPALTTAEIPVAKMGRVAATMLLSRIDNPDQVFCCTYVKTTPVFRESTMRNPG